MKHFKNGALTEWSEVDIKKSLVFESTRPKRVSFQVLSNSKVEVWAADNEKITGAVLQGASDDKLTVEYTAQGSSWVQIKAAKDASVFVNIRDLDQTIHNSGKDSFVNIEPRVRGNDEFARMMKFVKMNEIRRDQERAAEREELAKLRQEVSKAKAEQAQEPVPEAQSEQVEGDDATGATTAE